MFCKLGTYWLDPNCFLYILEDVSSLLVTRLCSLRHLFGCMACFLTEFVFFSPLCFSLFALFSCLNWSVGSSCFPPPFCWWQHMEPHWLQCFNFSASVWLVCFGEYGGLDEIFCWKKNTFNPAVYVLFSGSVLDHPGRCVLEAGKLCTLVFLPSLTGTLHTLAWNAVQFIDIPLLPNRVADPKIFKQERNSVALRLETLATSLNTIEDF